MSLSLESSLSRLRLGGRPELCLVHGPAASDALWLWRYLALKTSVDAELMLLASARVPTTSTGSPGVAFQKLSGPPLCIPVELGDEADRAAVLDPSSTPLGVMALLLESGLRCRAAMKLGGKDAATASEHTMSVVVEDLASLLVAHSTSDVVECLLDICKGVRGVRPSPLIVALDHRVCGEAAFVALSGVASIIIRLDEAPRPSGSAAGYLQGHMVVTELLATGKSRSFVQEYSVHGSGAVALGPAAAAGAAAAFRRSAAGASTDKGKLAVGAAPGAPAARAESTASAVASAGGAKPLDILPTLGGAGASDSRGKVSYYSGSSMAPGAASGTAAAYGDEEDGDAEPEDLDDDLDL